MLKDLLKDRYWLISMLNIFIVNFVFVVAKFFPSNYLILFYFLAVIAFSICSYIMLKMIDFESIPHVAISLIKLFQILIPVSTLFYQGYLLFF